MAIVEQGVLEATRRTDNVFDATLETLTDDSAIVYGLEIDNSDNPVDVYAKFYDNSASAMASGVGTTPPDMVLQVDKGDVRRVAFTRGVVAASVVTPAAGMLFDDAAGVGLKGACVTDPGTGGTTSPTNDVTLKLHTD
jgi:hypothetical protein